MTAQGPNTRTAAAGLHCIAPRSVPAAACSEKKRFSCSAFILLLLLFVCCLFPAFVRHARPGV
jgi:hypothetical protein